VQQLLFSGVKFELVFMKIADVDLMNIKTAGWTALNLLRITVLMQKPALVGHI
jgi:hypothetical protein